MLENFYLDEHVRYVLTVYPVAVLWLAGSVSQSDQPGSYIYDFSGMHPAFSVPPLSSDFCDQVTCVVWRSPPHSQGLEITITADLNSCSPLA